MKNKIYRMNPIKSLKVNKGWKEILLKSLIIPKGFLDPESCRKIKWSIIITIIKKGNIKWREKNRLRVALLIANPPQTHSVTIVPIKGMAVNKFVITVAPQNDICPQGRTYPKKAVAIEIKKIDTPTSQVFFKLNEW